MAKVVITDTCFWLGLVDPKDQYHERSKVLADLIGELNIIFPWPCLYETISTHLTRRRDRLLYLEEFINKSNIILLDDSMYKTKALNEVFLLNRVAGFTYSLTDSVIREVLKDVTIRINYLATFNDRDFDDICQLRKIEIVN